MDWTLDLGNSALKLRGYATRDFDAAECTRIANDEGLVERVREALTGGERAVGRAVLSSVGSAERTAQLLALLEGLGADCVTSVESRLEKAVREPESVGADRLFAALGALVRMQQDFPPTAERAIVLDAGTALTVDLVERVSEGSVLGRFLGGAIAPGPALTTEALARGGAKLFSVDTNEARVPALGQNTEEALRAGVVHGLRGTARELVRGLQGDGEALPVLVTGGAAFLLNGVFEAERTIVDPRLVDRGLFEVLCATAGT